MRIALALLLAVCVVVQANLLRSITLHAEKTADRLDRTARQFKQDEAIVCYKYACTAGFNETCDFSTGVLCKSGFECDFLQGKCITATPPKQKGETCDHTAVPDECDSMAHLDCVAVDSTPNYQCQVAHIYGAGETCTNSYECVEGLPCTSGRCVGKTSGQTCDEDAQCVSGHHCDKTTLTCAADAAAGANCDIRVGSPCGALGYCSVETQGNFIGKCGLPWGKTAGQVCADDLDCNWDNNLYCHHSNATAAFGTCSQIPSSSHTNCSDHVDCTAESHQCVCNYGSGHGQCMFEGIPYNSTWKTFFLSYYTCGVTNKCTVASTAPGSCMARNCANDVSCMTQLSLDYVLASGAIPEGCFTVPDFGQCTPPSATTGSGGSTTGSSSSASSVAFSALMMVFFVAAAML